MKKEKKVEAQDESTRGSGRQVAKPVRYNWPRFVNCPRCGSNETRRDGDYGETQYRVCVRAVPPCGHRFPVKGTPAASPQTGPSPNG